MDSCIQVEFEAETDDTYSNIAPLEVDRSHLYSSGVVLAKRDQNEDDEPSTSVIVVETHHQLLCTDHVCQKHFQPCQYSGMGFQTNVKTSTTPRVFILSSGKGLVHDSELEKAERLAGAAFVRSECRAAQNMLR